jgi:Asp-tRNA(Asn)/Glu-tRNA(Gln) amidotransferase A subunit family amidase
MQSIVTIRNEIAAGEITPREAVARSLDAIDAKDGFLHAIARLADRDAVLKAAEAATGPLAGIAIGIKDIFDTHDMPTGYGTPIYHGFQPRADAALVAMARSAGASIVAKTVTTEYAFLNPARTLNPHNLAHTPGGSSSGSAAAVASGMLPAATGTQTGGSIIRPAAYCGIAGYKPSFRLLPATGTRTFSWTLDTAGLLAAGVADLALLAEGLTGRRLAAAAPALFGLRIAIYRTAVWSDADADMQAAVARAAIVAGKAGAIVTEIGEPEILTAARDAHATIQNYEAGLALGSDLALYGDRMSAILRQTLEAGQAIDPEAYDAARSVARRARKAATALFETCDLLLTPSAPGAAPHGLASTGSPVFNRLWTLTGNPCINVPQLRNTAGMPVGIQLVARFGRDDLVLSAGAALERIMG